jgi:two-component system cell cycle response regulator
MTAEEKTIKDDGPIPQQNAGPKKVLMADDEPKNIAILEGMLAGHGYRLLTAENGREALDKAFSENPDLILLDILMPELNGFEVTRKLKKDPRTKNIPIILVTGLDTPESRNTGLEAGAEDFLNKPVNAVELQTRVKSMLSLKQYRDELSVRDHSEDMLAEALGVTASPRLPEREDVPLVLLVEDNRVDAEIIRRFVRDEPLRLAVAETGGKAFSLLNSEKVDLILLDILLPDMSGFEIFQILKKTEKSRDIPIIIITCLSNLESKIMGLELGSDDFLVKPIVKRELLARMRILLEKKAQLDGLRSHYESALKTATIDWLTGLYNHGHFKKVLELEIKRSLRHPYPISLIILDVDNFKECNDRLGHSAGDSILHGVGQAVRSRIREIDLAARYGGDEFAVILPYSDGDGTVFVAQRIQEAIRCLDVPQTEGQGPAALSVSMGIAVFPEDASTAEEIVKMADQMLYRAKKNGKNQFCIYGRGPGERP